MPTAREAGKVFLVFFLMLLIGAEIILLVHFSLFQEVPLLQKYLPNFSSLPIFSKPASSLEKSESFNPRLVFPKPYTLESYKYNFEFTLQGPLLEKLENVWEIGKFHGDNQLDAIDQIPISAKTKFFKRSADAAVLEAELVESNQIEVGRLLEVKMLVSEEEAETLSVTAIE